jgi:polyvinyl alcohol dehydrogenase (cytochrome)
LFTSYSDYIYAIDSATGSILWNFNTGGFVIDGPSIVKGMVFWGSSDRHIAPRTDNDKVYAFTVPASE